MYTIDGPGVLLRDGAVALRSCRFERCRAAGSAVVDIAFERLRAEDVVFEDNGESRPVSAFGADASVYASPPLQVRKFGRSGGAAWTCVY